MTRRQTTDASGFVYLITNGHFDGWVKVGQSTNPVRRLASYQTSDPTRSYQLAAVFYADDRRHAEWAAHDRLKKLGFEHSSEWFRVDLMTAARIARVAAATLPPFSLSSP